MILKLDWEEVRCVVLGLPSAEIIWCVSTVRLGCAHALEAYKAMKENSKLNLNSAGRNQWQLARS